MPANQVPEHELEQWLRKTAAAFPYPLAPDIASRQRQSLADRRAARVPSGRRVLAFALAMLLLAAAAALLVSPARARVLDWIRIGSVRIFYSVPTPTAPLPVPSGTPSPEATPTHLQSVLDLAGATSLEEAQESVRFPILIPAYPPDLGEPDQVYLQELGGQAVILVWLDPERPASVRMSLSESASNVLIFNKYEPRSVQETTVGGQEALWIEGDYLLMMRGGDVTLTRLMNQGHTLIWKSGSMTFRLETDLDLETAIRIAESIR